MQSNDSQSQMTLSSVVPVLLRWMSAEGLNRTVQYGEMATTVGTKHMRFSFTLAPGRVSPGAERRLAPRSHAA